MRKFLSTNYKKLAFAQLALFVVSAFFLGAGPIAVTPIHLWMIIGLSTLPILALLAYGYNQSKALQELRQKIEGSNAQIERIMAGQNTRAHLDPLTGILNRQFFIKAAFSRKRKTDQGSLMIVEADNLREVNSNFGEEAGDEALQLIVSQLRNSVREFDTIGRLGGAKFAVMLSSSNQNEAKLVAERVRSSVKALTFKPDNQTVCHLSVSVGVAIAHTNTPMDGCMESAERALNLAKSNGGNRVELALAVVSLANQNKDCSDTNNAQPHDGQPDNVTAFPRNTRTNLAG